MVDNNRTRQLSPRQQEVLNLMCQGLSSKEIARMLGMAYQTVQTHQKAMYRTTGAKSGMELVTLELSKQTRETDMKFRVTQWAHSGETIEAVEIDSDCLETVAFVIGMGVEFHAEAVKVEIERVPLADSVVS